MNEVMFGLFRHLVTVVGTYFAAKGDISAGDAEAISGAIGVLGAAAWSVWSKRKAR